MSAAKKYVEFTLLDVEMPLASLPVDVQRAIQFAYAHDRLVVIGHVPDEGSIYLQTMPNPDVDE